MRRARRSVLAALALLAGAALAVWLAPREEEIVGRATAMDGDSLRVDGVEIRLEGIDAPEIAQLCDRDGEPWRCGREARAVLADALRGEIVSCRISNRDRYRRRLARCDAKGKDLGGFLVSEGWALAYGAYEREERRARRARAGLWSGRFERPSDWRKAQ